MIQARQRRDSQERQSPARDKPNGMAPLFVVVGLALAVTLRQFEPIWRVSHGLLVLGVLSALAYLAGRFARLRSDDRGVMHALLVTLVVSQPIMLVLWGLSLGVPRIALAGELVLLFVAIAAVGWRSGRGIHVAVAGVFLCLTSIPSLVGLLMPGPVAEAAIGPDRRYVFSSYHDLRVTTHEVVSDETQDGGALTLLPDGRILLVAGSGAARSIEVVDGSDEILVSTVDLGLPIDIRSYQALGRKQPKFYRVFDALYDDGRLFVSYIHWDPDQDCYSLRLAESIFDGSDAGPWKTRFESRPCVPIPFTYNTSGGRIAVLDEGNLLLSVGAFGMDQLIQTEARYEGWSEASDYGKILVLDRDTWEHSVFTMGHRNPQGLLVAGDRIWSTEHGPHGGDELNRIEAGSDYGWPFASYGTDYGRKTLESGGVPGDHRGYTQPLHAWIPSIGISNLIEVDDGLFPMWRGDLLVGSLSGLSNGYAIFRVRLVEGRVVSVERIPVESRVRDLVQLHGGGPLVLWDSDGNIRVVRPADHVFSQCAACHNVRLQQHGIGPDLYGIVGRSVAGHADYRYSEAMTRLEGRWTPERLDRFLQDPQGEVPGTTMDHGGVHDPVQRAEIIQFLSEVSAGRPGM